MGIILCGSITRAALIPIADFRSSIRTHQGGFFRCIGGRPNQIVDQLVTLGQPEAPAWRIDLNGKAASNGVGVLVPIFDETTTTSTPLRIGRGKLILRVLGQLGRRRLRIELVSASNPESAGLLLGTVKADRLDSNTWKEIRLAIPLDQTGSRTAAYIRILVEGPGKAWFALDSLAISTKVTKPSDSIPTTDLTSPRKIKKALWFWETEKTLSDEHSKTNLLELCQSQGITDLYCQIPYSYEDDRIELRLANEQRAFNAAAHSLGITMHALDGGPDFVFQKNHPRMIRLLEALGKLNKQGAPNERYRAVHLDNEPYVLPGWQNDDKRREIIKNYIVLNQKLRSKADELGMAFGVDIPFWWDLLGADGKAKFTYDTEAGKQPILEALFPLLDNVGIMSYRVRVTGPNGLVFHCLNEFELGEKLGVDVFTAMELGTGDDVDKGTTFGVYPWSYFHGQLSTLETVLSRTPGCAGYSIHYAKPFAEAVK